MLGSVVAIVLLYWPTSRWLLTEWTSSDVLIEHGALVGLIALALLARAAGFLSLSTTRPFWPAMAVVAMLSLAWLALRAANVAMGQVFLLPLLMLAALVATLGLRAGRSLAPPILFVFFALPIWEILKVPLRDLTIFVVEGLLRLGGVSAIIEGALVHIPAGTFRIANGCSGLNLLIVGSALAALYGYLFYTSIRKRVLLLAIGVGIALLGNWTRVALIIAIGNATDMQTSLVEDHQVFGWTVFAILQIPFFMIAMWLGRGEPRHAARRADAADRNRLPSDTRLALLAALGCLAIGPAWAGIVVGQHAQDARAVVELPQAVAGWRGPLRNNGGWSPIYHGQSGEAIGQYVSANGPVWLYLNVYLSQDQGRELVYIHNRVRGDLELLSSDTFDMQGSDGERLVVRDVVVDQGLRQRRIMYWYEVDGRRIADDTGAKLRQAQAVLFGNPAAGIVAVSSLCDIDCANAGERIREFVMSMGQDYRLAYHVEDGR